jgi:ubiquitin-protein ligase
MPHPHYNVPMPDRIATPMDDAQMAHFAAHQVGIAWSPEQLVRLEHEWRQLQRNFAYHPAMRVVPVKGNPPAEYQVDFKARTLFIRDDGQLDYLDAPSVHIWLPPGYPHEAPVVRPMQAIFHPNVTMDGIWVNPAWEPTRTLAQLVQQLGAVLAYHTYDPWNVWNPAAMDWVAANGAYLPTDPAANFSPNAGGEPLGRICQHGNKALELLREQLKTMCDSLVKAETTGPIPTPQEVRGFAEQIRLTTNLYLDEDVPQELRSGATELDQWAESLPSVTMVFDGLRQRHVAASAALTAAGRLAESRRALIKELASLSDLVDEPPEGQPYRVIEQLPPLAKMQSAQVSLRTAAAEAEKRLTSARAKLAALSPPEPRMHQTHSSLLEKTIEAELGRTAWAVQDAHDKSEAAINTIAGTVERAKDELIVFGRVIGWREYADLTVKSRELIERAVEWGSAGVQAYFVENEGGSYGPFEFEQRLDFGMSALAVRNTGRTSIEVFDLQTGGKLASSDTGETTIQLPGGDDATTYDTTFRMTARCGDLWLQAEYLTRQIGERLGRLSKPANAPRAESWAKAYDQALSRAESLATFVEETRQGMLERDTLVSDLKQLARFKERLTTQFLLERYCEMVPRFQKEQAEARTQMDDANRRIAVIFSKSQRDVETGQPMIPPKWIREYEEQTKRRDDMQRPLDRYNRRFALAEAHIRPRLANAVLLGSDHVPGPVRLPGLPGELIGRAPVLNDGEMIEQIEMLERELGVRLRPEPPAAPAQRPTVAQPSSSAAPSATPPPLPGAPAVPAPAVGARPPQPVVPPSVPGKTATAEPPRRAPGTPVKAVTNGTQDAAAQEAVEPRPVADPPFTIEADETAEETHQQADWVDFGAGQQSDGDRR